MIRNNPYVSAGVDRGAAARVIEALGLRSEPFASDAELDGGVRICAAIESPGTKAVLLAESGEYETIGWDAAAMAINDVTARGASCCFLLDHVSVNRLDEKTSSQMIKGVMNAAAEAGARLIGGELAQLPGIMTERTAYVTVTAIGFAKKLLELHTARPGDLIVGLRSTGPHANGYSLIRAGKVRGREILEPARIYRVEEISSARCAAHITGGGLPEKIGSLLSDDLHAEIDPGRWGVPEVFIRIQSDLQLDDAAMWEVFNMGIGMAVCVPATMVKKDDLVIGEVFSGAAFPRVAISGVNR